jgi:HK97 gp10 family phage protein
MLNVYISRNSLRNQNKTRSACRYADNAITNAFYQHGAAVEALARKRILQPPKTGQYYYIAELKRLHRASAPGQYPANMLGNLQKSLNYNVGPMQMEFGANTDYAPYLELGTASMAKRPFLEPSTRQTQGDMQQQYYTALRKVFKI